MSALPPLLEMFVLYGIAANSPPPTSPTSQLLSFNLARAHRSFYHTVASFPATRPSVVHSSFLHITFTLCLVSPFFVLQR